MRDFRIFHFYVRKTIKGVEFEETPSLLATFIQRAKEQRQRDHQQFNMKRLALLAVFLVVFAVAITHADPGPKVGEKDPTQKDSNPTEGSASSPTDEKTTTGEPPVTTTVAAPEPVTTTTKPNGVRHPEAYLLLAALLSLAKFII